MNKNHKRVQQVNSEKKRELSNSWILAIFSLCVLCIWLFLAALHLTGYRSFANIEQEDYQTIIPVSTVSENVDWTLIK